MVAVNEVARPAQVHQVGDLLRRHATTVPDATPLRSMNTARCRPDRQVTKCSLGSTGDSVTGLETWPRRPG
jgi:hypothetical protein